MIEELVSRVFATRNWAHLAHWQMRGPGSFARHMALGSFYDDIIEKLDEIVEVYQGAKGLIGPVPAPGYPSPDTNASVHVNGEADWIATNREAIANGVPSVLNLVDELHAIYCQTGYKLRFLE